MEVIVREQYKYILRNNYLYLCLEKDTYLCDKISQRIVTDRARLQKNEPMPLIIDARKITGINKEARDHFSTISKSRLLTCIAIVTKDMVTSVIVNYFLKVSKPAKNIAVFTSFKNALIWVSAGARL